MKKIKKFLKAVRFCISAGTEKMNLINKIKVIDDREVTCGQYEKLCKMTIPELLVILDERKPSDYAIHFALQKKAYDLDVAKKIISNLSGGKANENN